jgi:hypothetical protein
MMNIGLNYIVKRGYTNYTMEVYKRYTPNNAHINYLAYGKMEQNSCKKRYKKVHIIIHFSHNYFIRPGGPTTWGINLHITPKSRENEPNSATPFTTPKSISRNEAIRRVLEGFCIIWKKKHGNDHC